MKTTTLILSAIIAILPFAANARYYDEEQGFWLEDVSKPEHVREDGTAIRASIGPYATAVLTGDDETHIATTAYVKGAYNDTIAGLNRTFQEIRNVRDDVALVYVDGEDSTDYMHNIVLQSIDDVRQPNRLVNGMAVKNAMNAQRIRIYTTWDTNDTTKVDLLNTWDADYDD